MVCRHYEGLIDSDGRWHLVETGVRIEIEDYRYDYAPFRELNELLKGITESRMVK